MSHVTSDDLPRVGSQRASRSCHFNDLDAARVPHGYPPGNTPPCLLSKVHPHPRSLSPLFTTTTDQQAQWQPRSWESVNEAPLEQKVGVSVYSRIFPFSSFHSLTLSCPALPLRSPSKRRTRAPRILEEVGNPSISSTRQLRSRTRDCSPQQENDPNVKASTAGNVPSKHTVSDEKPLSPKKNDSHVSAAKSVSGKSSCP